MPSEGWTVGGDGSRIDGEPGDVGVDGFKFEGRGVYGGRFPSG